MRFRSCLTPRVSNIPHQSIGVYAAKAGSDARIESLRSFQLAFIDEYAVPGKPFNAAVFEAKVKATQNFSRPSPMRNLSRVVRS